MKPQIRAAFSFFWPSFTPDSFRAFFPYVYEKYDLVYSRDPEVVFYSVFAPGVQHYPDPRNPHAMPRLNPGKFLRVFITGENFEPNMAECEFAITLSALTDHPNHLWLPHWVYENRAWGYGPDRLVKPAGTDWEKVAREKTKFCNFVYGHPIAFRDAVFQALSRYKPIDSAGPRLNTMNGWTVPSAPNRLAGKLGFMRDYKFTLSLENMIWPGYLTEKLPDPMYVGSLPIHVGDPLARNLFNPESYIDITDFSSVAQMLEFVREVDNDDTLYLKMLAAPWFRGNRVPARLGDARTLAFFDKIFEAAIARRQITPA
jgi:alpha(1,3/1,4) fucosyltransferase